MINNKLSESTFNLQQQNFLKDLFIKYRTGCGLRQSNDQMSNLTPIEVELKPGSSVLRKLKFEVLRKAGIVTPAKNPVWGHPVFVVTKKISKPKNWVSMSNKEREDWKEDNLLNHYRMVANMIKLNQITQPTTLNLPNLEMQLMSIKNTRFYATLDILSGFDFLPTREEHREIFTLVTRRSTYTLNGAPMGWSNTPALFFGQKINEVIDQDGDYLFNTEENGVLAWLDDFLVYSTSLKNLCIIL
eukprot:maker-scaffold_56-snap-gene-1.65-mRNA-1 protein AED:0.48 eAED:0.55 QI:0/0/0/1/0/0/2/0/243